MTIRALTIDPEFSGLIPPLTRDEREKLEQGLLADGCIDALAVWHDTLIDGHNRYEICQKHNLDFGIVNIPNLETRDDVKIWICQHQLGRRNLSDYDRVELALLLKPLIEAKSKEKQKNAPKAAPIGVRPNSDEHKMRTDQAISDMAGVGKTLVRQVEQIQAKAAPEVIAAVKAEEISVNKAAELAKLPKEEQAAAMAEPKKKKEKPEPKPEDDSCSVAELGKALEASDNEVRALQLLVESLKSSDLAKEVAKWHMKYDQLAGRLQLAIKQKNEADKQAKYSTGLLRKIREALKVQTNGEILQAIHTS